MKKIMFRICLVLVLLVGVFAPFVSSENPYILEDSIGKRIPTPQQEYKPFDYIPIENWVGHKFLILPSISKKGEHLGFRDSNGAHPSKAEIVGKICTVTKVTGERFKEVTFKMDDSGEIYIANAYNDTINDIVLLADLENARSKWLGKTLWFVDTEIKTFDSDTNDYGSIAVKRNSPLKVVNIVAGWDSDAPIWFILQTLSGEEGFINIHVSDTNVSESFRDICRFEDYFLEEDPRKTYKWDEKIWSAIDKGEVFLGMTKQQVIMSWGKPERINRTVISSSTSEQWVYGRVYLYFDNGILTSFQD
jgi:hypothetical protein